MTRDFEKAADSPATNSGGADSWQHKRLNVKICQLRAVGWENPLSPCHLRIGPASVSAKLGHEMRRNQIKIEVRALNHVDFI